MTTSYYDKSPETFNELIDLAVQRINNKFDDDNHIVYLAWKGTYSEEVSCSHYAPKGKSTNWCARNKNQPHAYPGWQGRVWVSHRYDRNRFGSEVLHNTGISSGTGGYGLYDLPDWVNIDQRHLEYTVKNPHYGHYPLSYDSRIFDLDFPLLSNLVKQDLEVKKKQHKADQVTRTLEHRSLIPFRYQYPSVQAAYVNPNYERS